MRLVLDCRLTNPHMAHRRVKLEDLSVLLEIVRPGDFGAVDDLESGYHQVLIELNLQCTLIRVQYCTVHHCTVHHCTVRQVALDPAARTFFGCHWAEKDTGRKRYFRAKVLILGIKDAVFAFSR